MAGNICRWGILGTAFIAHKNWQAIRKSGNGTLVGVASRDLSRAQQFINECQSQVPFPTSPTPFGSYEDLIRNPEIDALYIPLPTGVRKDWVLRAAAAGKHVLVEKPVGATLDDVHEIVAACKQHGVQFMDGVMFMHSQRLAKLREVLDDGESVGNVRRIVSQFTFSAPDDFRQNNIRVHGGLEPLGCLGDLGWYNIRFILWTMQYKMPTSVRGRMLNKSRRVDSPNDVPVEFSGELFFDDGVSGSFYCSFLTENQEWSHISGTKGSVHVSDFVVPYYGAEAAFQISAPILRIQGCNFNMEEHTRRAAVNEYSSGGENSQETNMFRRFSELVQSGQIDTSWADITIKTQTILDVCLDSAKQGKELRFDH